MAEEPDEDQVAEVKPRGGPSIRDRLAARRAPREAEPTIDEDD